MGNASRLAIGMVELNSIARGIETCDYMVKAARWTSSAPPPSAPAST